MYNDHKYNEKICVDCGNPFSAYHDKQIRCPECQKRYRAEQAKIRCHKIYLQKKEERARTREKADAVIINGHVQICTHLKSCVYGQDSERGCSYCLETGHTRKSQGLFIVDGKCPAYRRKKSRMERHGRQRPFIVTGRSEKLFYEV